MSYYSITKICLAVKADWQAWHSGWFSPFKWQAFVSLVWPIQRRLITTLLWRLSDDIFAWWPITGCTLYSLFDVHWLHSSHSLAHSWLTQVNRSLTRNFIPVTGSSMIQNCFNSCVSTFVSSDTHVSGNPAKSQVSVGYWFQCCWIQNTLIGFQHFVWRI